MRPIMWLLSAATSALALQAGVPGWYKPLLGVPRTTQFHRTLRAGEATSSVVLSATQSNVLGGLYPENGTIAWRYLFEENDPVLVYKAQDSHVAFLSGPGGSSLRLLDVHTGHLISETFLHPPASGRLLEPATVGVALAFGSDDAIYALTNGHTLRRVQRSTGDVVWGWTAPDHTSLVVYSDVVTTPDAIYLLGLAKSFASYTLHIATISPATGELVHETSVPSSITGGPQDLIVLSRPSSPRRVVAWLEQGRIHSVALDSQLHSAKAIKPTVNKGSTYLRLQDVGIRDEGLFVGIKDDGSARVVKLTEDGSLKSIWEFSDSATSPKYTESIFTGGRDKDGYPYIARVFWSHVFGKASAHVFAPHLAEGKGLVTGFTFPFKTEKDGIIVHAALDATTLPSGDATEDTETYKRILSRLVLTTSTGSVQLWVQDKLEWTREEGLASVTAAGWVKLGDGGVSSGQVEMEEHESFAHRLARQIKDAQGFPAYVIKFVKRFVSGNYDSSPLPAVPSSSSLQANSTTTISRDQFGFRKLIVAGTSHGKLYALDSTLGEVVWSRVFGLGWAGEVGGHVVPLKVFVVRGVAEVADAQNEGHRGPEVVVVAQRKANNGLVDTVLYHVDALTGEDISIPLDGSSDSKSPSRSNSVLEGRDIVAGPLVEAYLVSIDPSTSTSPSSSSSPSTYTKFLVVLDEFLQFNVYPPPSPASLKHFTEHVLPTLHIPLRTGKLGNRKLTGHRVGREKEFTGKHIAFPVWSGVVETGEDIVGLVTRGSFGSNALVAGQSESGNVVGGEVVASFGKVLANRTTLYKYLNPNAIVLLTSSSPSSSPTSSSTPSGSNLHQPRRCGVYVVDGVKGTILYRALLPADGERGCNVKAVLTENWLVYEYYDPGIEKGYRVVSVEFYEGKKADDSIRSSELSSYSNQTTEFSVYEQSFVFPKGVTALAMTSTKFGMTVKDIVVATTNGQIQTFPRRFLDPRRPTNRKPTNEEQSEEWLIAYDPVIPDDPKRVLSHEHYVARIRKIITSPSLLESTSLVFAYGLDLFGSGTAPSKTFDVLSEGFNKANLVGTLSALSLGIVIVRPMVRRKKLREKWYDS
ncbi:DUF1620-domain-containing protein [Panus rudis PR-1116 ss-1]|nr:DUF1620-domain-containing protein [Panus rudis PR-1116 ss-1]